MLSFFNFLLRFMVTFVLFKVFWELLVNVTFPDGSLAGFFDFTSVLTSLTNDLLLSNCRCALTCPEGLNIYCLPLGPA